MSTTREALLAQRRKIAQQVVTMLSADSAVSAVLVFGSVASGQVDKHSDVDLFVFYRSAIPSAFAFLSFCFP